MVYNQERAFEAFKMLGELNPATTPYAFNEFTELEKQGLDRDYNKIHNRLVSFKVGRLMDEASKLMKTVLPIPEHKVQ